MAGTPTTTSPSVRTMARRIQRVYETTTPETREAGARWYDDARLFAKKLARTYGVTVDQAACVIAAHSMNAPWWMTKQRADYQLRAAMPNATSMAVGMGAAKAMASAAIDNPDNPFAFIVGAKLRPFAYNIAGDENHVATDRWAQRAVFGADDNLCRRMMERKGMRQRLITAYQQAAAAAGVTPAVMQATVWCHVRGGAH